MFELFIVGMMIVSASLGYMFEPVIGFLVFGSTMVLAAIFDSALAYLDRGKK